MRITLWMGLLALAALLGCDHDCNFQNCADGCCGAHGVCYVGQSSTHCGINAAACIDCSLDLGACNNGVCAAQCTSTSCGTGCCASDGSCHAGTADTQCGSGRACTDCTAQGEKCGQGGECGTPCGSGCSGCCGTDGLCHTGTASGACGAAGTTCVDCAASGMYCNTGHCVQCDVNTCPNGCCSASGACESAGVMDEYTCGTNGQACQDCTPDGLKCTQAGQCGTCNDINVSCLSTSDCCRPWTCDPTSGQCG